MEEERVEEKQKRKWQKKRVETKGKKARRKRQK